MQAGTCLLLHVVHRFTFWFNAGLCRVFQSLSSSSLVPLYITQQAQREGFAQQLSFVNSHQHPFQTLSIQLRNCWWRGEIR